MTRPGTNGRECRDGEGNVRSGKPVRQLYVNVNHYVHLYNSHTLIETHNHNYSFALNYLFLSEVRAKIFNVRAKIIIVNLFKTTLKPLC